LQKIIDATHAELEKMLERKQEEIMS